MFEENFGVYGVRKVWRQLKREGHDVARCTVERLMRTLGLQGVIRGKPVRTTISDKATPCPLDHVNRQFKAAHPNALWLSDFTYVATWAGFVYVAFVIDAYARRIVGWRVSRTAHAGFVLDALEQALHTGGPSIAVGLCITATEAANTSRSNTPSAGRSGHRTIGGQRRRQLRQCSGRNHQRSLQSRGHPSARPVAVVRRRRVRNVGMGRLVQQSPAAGAHRQHPAGRGREALLRHTGPTSYGGVTQTKQPPENPGRFIATHGRTIHLGHVWTAPWQEPSDVTAALVGCGHVSGLLMRQVWPLALMLCADRVPIERLHLEVR